MISLINSVKAGSHLLIDGYAHRVVGVAKYATAAKPDDVYYKIFMDDHHVLALSPKDDFIC